MRNLEISWKPPGPINQAFFRSEAFIQCAMGPYGCGKTSTICAKIPTLAAMQTPSPVDGIRRTKVTVLKDTYRNLEKTTIPSWTEWFPRSVGKWRGGGGGEPAIHEIDWRFGEGPTQRLRLTVEFLALGDRNVEEVCRGLETTWVWLNEGDIMPKDIFTYVFGRCGRYPAMRHGGPRKFGIIVDYNAPDTDNWLYELVEEKREKIIKEFMEKHPLRHLIRDKREIFQFFRWPSAFSPEAENVENLAPGYYHTQRMVMEPWQVKRYLMNEYGYSREGEPVYPEFADSVHVASTALQPMPKRQLVVGLDAGRTPAAVPMQLDPEGQMRWYPELCLHNVSAKGFGEALKAHLAEFYPDNTDVLGVADPAADYGSDTSEDTWIEIVSNTAKIRVVTAPSQNLVARLSAVRNQLTRMITGNKPALLLDPRAKMLRKGFNNGYHYKRVEGTGPVRYRDEPEKNEFSHPHDAGQYGALHLTGYAAVVGRTRHRGAKPRVELNDDPFAL